MISMSVNYAAEKLEATLIGEDAFFSSVSTDTRHIRPGDLFVALQGEHFDGHDFVDLACERGAVALMVKHQVSRNIPQILVEDTRLGLGMLSREWRKMAGPKLIALTGSNGKTTLKEMLAAILSEKHDVLATKGNLNNDIGVPLTLLRLQSEDIAVIEMGANHVGEIDYLSRLAMPDVAILNNAGRAHLGEFGSEENIARGKAEILNGLQKNGIFIYNSDSRWSSLWEELAEGVNSIAFGTSVNADYRGIMDNYSLQWADDGYYAEFSVFEKQTSNEYVIRLSLAGRHNCLNALAAVAACREIGMDVESIQRGLVKLKPVAGRLNPVTGSAGQVIIDDSYNANPDSVTAAIDVLVTAPGRKLLVLGDLAELGVSVDQLHAQLGELAFERGVDRLYTCGIHSKAASDAFAGEALHFASREELARVLLKDTGAADYVLVKGSRSAAMDKVVSALCSTAGEGAAGGVQC